MSEEKQASFEETELGAAMQQLSTLKPQEGKAAMMSQVDAAVERVLKVLAEGDPDALQKGTYLTQIRFVLTIMESCKEFRDAAFTKLVRRRVEEIMLGLENLPKRSKELKAQKKQAAADAKNKATNQAGGDTETSTDGKKKKKKKEKPKEPEFQYELAEKICIQSVVRHFDAKLDCLRSVHLHGRHSTEDIGIAPLFLYTVEFSILIEDAIKALIIDSREILTRRVYNETDPKSDEEKIRVVLRDKQRGLMEVVESGFSGWGSSQKAAEKAAKAAEAPAKKAGPEKKEKKGGLFSKLLGKEKKPTNVAVKKPVKTEKQVWEKVMEGWKEHEAKGEIFFPRTFNFSMLTYLSGLREKLFSSEVQRIIQIAEQAQGGSNAKGAVSRGLEQTFKNNDQNFFEMVILNLLYTKNDIGLEEIQSACMGQKLDEGRLPLSVPEMGRRPNAYAVYIIKLLHKKCEPRHLEVALTCFFEALLILHLMKYEKDFKNASTYIETQKETLPKALQGIVDGILGLMDRVNFSRQQARETGENTTRNTRDTIQHTIGKFMTAYTAMYEKINKS